MQRLDLQGVNRVEADSAKALIHSTNIGRQAICGSASANTTNPSLHCRTDTPNMRRCLLTLATAHALRPSLMLLPGASTGRITEDEARKRTSWPHWKRESDWTADEEEAAVAPPSPTTPQKAYTLAYFQDRVKARARKDALLGLVAATGRLCDAARATTTSRRSSRTARATEVAAERDVPLDAPRGGPTPAQAFYLATSGPGPWYWRRA